jgi:hypothetical protein
MESLQNDIVVTAPSEQGVVILVDISGFTALVYEMDLFVGRDTIFSLLSSIIKTNQLSLNIAELEGDAVFYYRLGPAPSHKEIFHQYERMLHSFWGTVSSIAALKEKSLPLSLKMIVHYGDIAQYQINGFEKLYGKVITEAHLLLKNNVQSHSYILMTEDYLKQVDPLEIDETYLFHSQCEILNGVKQVYYSSFDYAKTLAS